MARHPYQAPPGISKVCGTYNINAGTPGAPFLISVGETYVPGRARAALRQSAASGVVARLANQIAPYAQPPLRNRVSSVAQRLITERGGMVAYLGTIPEHVVAFGMARRISTRPGLLDRHLLFEQFGVPSHEDVMRRRGDEPERVSRYLAGCAGVLACTMKSLSDNALVLFPEQADAQAGDTRTGAFFTSLGCTGMPDLPPWGSGQGVLYGLAGAVRQELERQFPFLTKGIVAPDA